MRLPSLTAIYEEWLAVIRCGQDRFPTSTAKVLKILAREHSDDGARFNAVMLLDEAGQLEIADLETVLTRETLQRFTHRLERVQVPRQRYPEQAHPFSRWQERFK